MTVTLAHLSHIETVWYIFAYAAIAVFCLAVIAILVKDFIYPFILHILIGYVSVSSIR